MDSSAVFPKCAKKCLRKIILPFTCVNKKPKAKAVSSLPPPSPATPSPPPRKEDVHDGGHQPSMGRDFNRVEEFVDHMSRIPGSRRFEVSFGMDHGGHMDDHYYHHEYDCSTSGTSLPMPPLPPLPPFRYRVPFLPPLPPSPPRGMLPPPPDYDYAPAGPFIPSCPCGYAYARRGPPPAYYDDYYDW